MNDMRQIACKKIHPITHFTRLRMKNVSVTWDQLYIVDSMYLVLHCPICIRCISLILINDGGNINSLALN